MKQSTVYRVVSRTRGTREHPSLGGACLDCRKGEGEIIERVRGDGRGERVREGELPVWARKRAGREEG